MYSDLYLQQKNDQKFAYPRVFVIAMVAAIAFVSSQAYFWYTSVPTQASEVEVKRIKPVNVTDAALTLYVETEAPVGAYVLFGDTPQQMKNTAYDRGDQSKSQTPRKHHVFLLEGLKADTTYWYQIIADNKLLQSGGINKFSERTRSQTAIIATHQKPLYGKVTSPNGQGLADAIIIVEIQERGTNAVRSMTLSRPSGEWLMTLSSQVAEEDILQIEIMHESYDPSQVQTLMKRAAPLPKTIVIGTDYVFSESDDVLSVQNVRARAAASNAVISILYPVKNAVIPDTRPLFKGSGVPGSTARVSVNSKPAFTMKTVVEKTGAWVIEPVQPFAPGTYTASIQLQDIQGTTRTLTRAFTIAKSGEQVLGETAIATPSGSLTPTRTTSTTPTGTQTASVTPTIITPTLSVTLTPSMITPTSGDMMYEVVTPTPSALVEAGEAFPWWLPMVGGLSMIVGYFFIRMSSQYLSVEG